MAILTAEGKTTALRVLQWDRNRIAQVEARGFDCEAYRRRQEAAYARLQGDVDVDQWPREMVDIFMSVLETFRSARRLGTRQYNIGPVQYPLPRLNLSQRRALRAFAAEIGVIENLREVQPSKWTDADDQNPDEEGDPTV